MYQWLNNWLHDFAHLFGGPAHMRYFLQPLVAVLLGIRDGRLDARAHATPFLWRLLFERDTRREAVRSAAGALWKPFVIATVLDAVVQYMVLRSVHVGQALFTGGVLVGIPYALVRAGTNRAVSGARARRDEELHA